jgi:hypothetical protein
MKLGLVLAAAGAVAQGEAGPAGDAERPPVPAPAAVAAPGSGVIPYPAAFFAEARPTTAFDMLQRLPGFTFDGGDEGVRGFAGAGGNVLIDGERPSAKSVNLADLLRRVPASAVERIELIRGGAPGVDMRGQPLVANVVRSRAASATTAVTAGVRAFGDGWVAPQLDVEWTRRTGDLALEGAAHATWETDPESGRGEQTLRAGSGALLATGPLHHRERGYTLQANGSAELNRGANVFRLNGGAEREFEGTGETVVAVGPSGAPVDGAVLSERRLSRRREVGGDWARDLGEGLSARLLGLHTDHRQTSLQRSEAGGRIETADQLEHSRESILRATATAEFSTAFTLEAGAEGALNVLDVRNAITAAGAPVAIPNAVARVEERRGEAFATGLWRPSTRLSLEASARAELSRISQESDTDLTRSFFFPKPRLVLSYTPGADSQFRLRVEREVGQLDFGDFAASAELGAGTVNAGAVDLEPERSWVFEVAAERRFWDDGAVVLTYTHAEVQQVVDLIPVQGRFDAPGNIGDGRRDQLKLTATLPLDRLGLSGAQVTTELVRRWSRVTDPVTGRSRRISNERPVEGAIRFSHDVDSLRSTWGIDADLAYSRTEYRIDEVRRLAYETFWTAYWDWKPRAGLSVRAEVQNLTARDFKRRRSLYDGSRALGRLGLVEDRRVRFEPVAYLRVRQAL